MSGFSIAAGNDVGQFNTVRMLGSTPEDTASPVGAARNQGWRLGIGVGPGVGENLALRAKNVCCGQRMHS